MMLDGQPLLLLILAVLLIPALFVYRRYHAPYPWSPAQNRSQSVDRSKPSKDVPDVELQVPLDLKNREVNVTSLFIHPIKVSLALSER
jgi:hypothetical protein